MAVALHDGHFVREDVSRLLAVPAAARLREEDPFTAKWTTLAGTQIVVHQSRFELDLNRRREMAVYLKPEDAWGLQVWQRPPPEEIISRSLTMYDAFYKELGQIFAALSQQFGRFVVLDLHSYNHRRDGADCLPAPAALNPEVNVGTSNMNCRRWAPLVERFMADLREFDFLGQGLDVRENVRFTGGHLARWTHANFPDSACVLAIEVKKFFMDEWTGRPEPVLLNTIRPALGATYPGLVEMLQTL